MYAWACDTDLKPGDKLKVKIVEAEEYDLIGERLP